MDSAASKEEGIRLLKSGQVDDAIRMLAEAARTSPDDPQIHTYLGAAYHKKGDKMHAIHEFEESLRLSECAKAYYNLGVVYEEVHRIDEAVRQYRMAAETDPNHAQAREALSRLASRFEAEHQPAQAPAPGGAPAQPTPWSAPQGLSADAWAARKAKEERDIAEQRAKLMRSGFAYGAVCGPLFMFFLLIVGIRFGFAPTAGLSSVLGVVTTFVIGVIYGGMVGFWVGTTCGGENAGMQAGASLGAVVGLVLGLLAGSIAVAAILAAALAIFSGLTGMLIGRLVEASIGWD